MKKIPRHCLAPALTTVYFVVSRRRRDVTPTPASPIHQGDAVRALARFGQLVRASRTGQCRRAEDLVDLEVGEDVLLPHELQDAVTRLQRLRGKLGRLVVADHGIERGDGADARLEVVLADV